MADCCSSWWLCCPALPLDAVYLVPISSPISPAPQKLFRCTLNVAWAFYSRGGLGVRFPALAPRARSGERETDERLCSGTLSQFPSRLWAKRLSQPVTPALAGVRLKWRLVGCGRCAERDRVLPSRSGGTSLVMDRICLRSAAPIRSTASEARPPRDGKTRSRSAHRRHLKGGPQPNACRFASRRIGPLRPEPGKEPEQSSEARLPSVSRSQSRRPSENREARPQITSRAKAHATFKWSEKASEGGGDGGGICAEETAANREAGQQSH